MSVQQFYLDDGPLAHFMLLENGEMLPNVPSSAKQTMERFLGRMGTHPNRCIHLLSNVKYNKGRYYDHAVELSLHWLSSSTVSVRQEKFINRMLFLMESLERTVKELLEYFSNTKNSVLSGTAIVGEGTVDSHCFDILEIIDVDYTKRHGRNMKLSNAMINSIGSTMEFTVPLPPYEVTDFKDIHSNPSAQAVARTCVASSSNPIENIQGTANAVTLRSPSGYEPLSTDGITKYTGYHPIFKDGFHQKVLSALRDTEGRMIMLEAKTGTGKSLVMPIISSSLGMVVVMMHDKVHARRLAYTLKECGYNNCQLVVKEHCWVNDMPEDVDARLRGADTREMLMPNLSRLWLLEKRVVITTYEDGLQLLEQKCYPAVFVMDDIYVQCDSKDVFLTAFNNDCHRPRDVKVLGMSAPVDGFPTGLAKLTPFQTPPLVFTLNSTQKCEIVDLRYTSTPIFCSSLIENLQMNFTENVYIGTVLQKQGLLDVFQRFQFSLRDKPWIFKASGNFFEKAKAFSSNPFDGWARVNDANNIINKIRGCQRHMVIDVLGQFFLSWRHSVQKLTAHSGNVLIFCPNVAYMDTLVTKIATFFEGVDMELIKLSEQSVVACNGKEIIYSSESATVLSTFLPLKEDKAGQAIPRIVFSVKVAESSVTLREVSLIIDCNLSERVFTRTDNGTVKQLVPSTESETDQRKGRGGRTRSSVYIQLPWDTSVACRDDMLLPVKDMHMYTLRLIRFFQAKNIDLNSDQMAVRLERSMPSGTMGKDGIRKPANAWKVIIADLQRLGMVTHEKVTLSLLGQLVVTFPGSFKENYIVALGTFAGCFRKAAAYVVFSRILDSVCGFLQLHLNSKLDENPTNVQGMWKTFFSDNDVKVNADFVNFCLSTAYFLQSNANLTEAALRCGLNPVVVRKALRQMRHYEEVLFVAVQRNLVPRELNTERNGASETVLRFVIVAASRGDLAFERVSDGRVITANGTFEAFDRTRHVEKSSNAPERPPHVDWSSGISSVVYVFKTLLDMCNGDPPKLEGKSAMPLLVAVFGTNLFTTVNEDRLITGEELHIGNVRIVSNQALALYNIRDKLRYGFFQSFAQFQPLDAFKAYQNTLAKLDIIYGNNSFPEYLTDGFFHPRMFSICTTHHLPPAGTIQHRMWCVSCYFIGHQEIHCLETQTFCDWRVTEMFKHFGAHHDAQWAKRASNIYYGIAYEGNCKICKNPFHTDCESKFRDESYCIRCNRTDCNNDARLCENPPAICDFCGEEHASGRHNEAVMKDGITAKGQPSYIRSCRPMNGDRSRFDMDPKNSFL